MGRGSTSGPLPGRVIFGDNVHIDGLCDGVDVQGGRDVR